ncbi:hypothetical protein M8J77_022869 [Diaphorina citri]|nr:hypothetical protein M8J77_022869 [Diaphorina citri]
MNRDKPKNQMENQRNLEMLGLSEDTSISSCYQSANQIGYSSVPETSQPDSMGSILSPSTLFSSEDNAYRQPYFTPSWRTGQNYCGKNCQMGNPGPSERVQPPDETISGNKSKTCDTKRSKNPPDDHCAWGDAQYNQSKGYQCEQTRNQNPDNLRLSKQPQPSVRQNEPSYQVRSNGQWGDNNGPNARVPQNMPARDYNQQNTPDRDYIQNERGLCQQCQNCQCRQQKPDDPYPYYRPCPDMYQQNVIEPRKMKPNQSTTSFHAVRRTNSQFDPTSREAMDRDHETMGYLHSGTKKYNHPMGQKNCACQLHGEKRKTTTDLSSVGSSVPSRMVNSPAPSCRLPVSKTKERTDPSAKGRGKRFLEKTASDDNVSCQSVMARKIKRIPSRRMHSFCMSKRPSERSMSSNKEAKK